MKATRTQSRKTNTKIEAAASALQNNSDCSEAVSNLAQAAPDADKDKHTAYYSALVGAWINTKMEKDKSLLTLATGGIGLLVTLLTTVGTKSPLVTVLYGLGFLLFLVSIISAISIFGRNANLIECLIGGEKPKERYLDFLDRVMFWSFILGLVAAVAIGLLSGTNIAGKLGGTTLSEDTKTSERPTTTDGQKSLTGLSKLSPSNASQSSGQGQSSGSTSQGSGSSGSTGGSQPASSSNAKK